MSAPLTLAQVNDRAPLQHKIKRKPVPLLFPATSTPGELTLADRGPQKTESANSDEPQTGASGVFTPAAPSLCLASFPSILVPRKIIRKLKGTDDIETLQGVALVFITCLKSIVRSLDQLAKGFPDDEEYVAAQAGAIFTCAQFHAHVRRKQRRGSTPEDRKDSVLVAIDLMSITIHTLKHLMAVTARLLLEHKPLPPLPDQDQVEESLPATLEELLEEIIIGDDTLDGHESVDTLIGEDVPLLSLPRARKKGVLRRLMSLVGGTSSLALVNPSDKDDDAFSEWSHLSRRPNTMYTMDIPLPAPIGNAAAMSRNSTGFIKDASLVALVHYLTTTAGALDNDLQSTFFVCFRLFSSPRHVFECLQARYNQESDPSYTADQRRAFVLESVHVKMRVIKMFIIWLCDHWRPMFDQDVLTHIIQFTLSGVMPETLSGKLIAALHNASLGNSGKRKRRQMELDLITSTVKAPSSTGFRFLSSSDFSQFQCSAGRHELARQLTVRASELFTSLDPVDAALHWHWHKGRDPATAQRVTDMISFEDSICYWVQQTILSHDTPTRRASVISFWISIATKCMRLRNFSVGSAVYAGITNTSVDRLKRTADNVPAESKAKLTALELMFDFKHRYKYYREALSTGSENLPSIPLLYVLIHDVRCVSEKPIKATDDGRVDLTLYKTVMKTVRDMEMGHVSYKLTRHEHIQNWLQSQLGCVDPSEKSVDEFNQQFDERSLALEGRNPSTLLWEAVPENPRRPSDLLSIQGVRKMSTRFSKSQPSTPRPTASFLSIPSLV